MKRNELSNQAKTRRKLKCTLPSEASQPEKATRYVIPTIWHVGKDKAIETGKKKKKRSVVARAWGLWREECRDRLLGIYRTVQLFCGEGDGTPLQYSCLENPMDGGAWWAAVHGVSKSWTWLNDFTFTFHFHALEKEMATHSSVLAWRIPRMGEPGGLSSMGSHRVRHDWSDLAAAAILGDTLRVKILHHGFRKPLRSVQQRLNHHVNFGLWLINNVSMLVHQL